MRITGLASGMDIDGIVQKMMEAERIKVDKVSQDRQILLWKQEIYNSLNKDFANFILNSKKEFGYKDGKSGGINWHKTATSSDEKIATVSSSANALSGTHDIKVNRLADGISAASKEAIGSNFDKTSIKTQLDISGTIEFTIKTKYGSNKFTFDESASMSDIVKKINESKAHDENGKVVKDAYGNEVSLGVKASYDSTIDRFFLQTTDTGKDAELSINADVGTTGNPTPAESFINALNLNVKSYGYNKLGDEYELISGNPENTSLELGKDYRGLNASIDYNGALGIEQDSNQFAINGINLNLQNTGSFKVKIDTDPDVIVDKVKKFIDSYNELIDNAGKYLREKTNRNFKPLTDQQKEAMSEKEIELWESKAKSGILRNDMDINNVLTRMRSDIYKNINTGNTKYKSVTDIGITTQEYSAGSVGGKLTLNEEKLRKAIEEDADVVMEILFKEDPNYTNLTDDEKLSRSELNGKRENSGMVTRIFDNLIMGMKDLIYKSGTGDSSSIYREVKSNILVDFAIKGGRFSGKGSISDLDDSIFKYDKRIEDLNTYLYRKENDYYSKFTAMEKAMQRASAQSGWLAQQLGGN